MTRRLILSLAAVLVGACSEVPTNNTGVTQHPEFVLYGTPDGNSHSYVGLLLFYDANGPAWFCTGSALDAHTVLTAGHCTFGATEAHYYAMEKPLTAFSTTAAFLAGGIVGQPIAHPDFGKAFPDTKDVGVVKFDATHRLDGPYATLAPLNGLNLPDKHQLFNIVGYGLVDVKPVEVFRAERIAGHAKLIQVKSGRGFFGPFNLELSSNNGRPHQGATCFGDSGGPILLGNVVYAVNSYVWNGNCTNSSYAFRVDMNPVRNWILNQ